MKSRLERLREGWPAYMDAITRDRVAVEEAAASAAIGSVVCSGEHWLDAVFAEPCPKCGAAV